MSENIREILRKNLAYHISNASITQVELAKKLNVSKSSITNWLTGNNSPNIETLAQICRLLNVKMSDMLNENNMKSEPLVTNKEQIILDKYKKLDEFGEKMVDTVLDIEYKRCTESNVLELEENEKTLINQYRKCDDNGKKVISSVLNMTSDIDAYRAAMSDDDHADEIIKMSKAEVDRLMSLPMTDEDL